MELLSFGKTGWGDELIFATIMTLAVSVTAMLIGFIFALISVSYTHLTLPTKRIV